MDLSCDGVFLEALAYREKRWSLIGDPNSVNAVTMLAAFFMEENRPRGGNYGGCMDRGDRTLNSRAC